MSPRLRNIDDAQVLRAMAHPLRLRLIGSLRKEGPATASELGRRLDQSSGATSYHLRILEKYGFVEDDPARNRGRERWWRAVDEGMEWTPDTDDPGEIEADRALGRQLVSEQWRWLRRWNDEMPEWDRSWRAASSISDWWFELTPDELRSLADEVLAVLKRYDNRRAPREGTERTIVLFHAFPERRDSA
jgi:DNA-binding transcriptional ArsR family regulator